MKYLVDSNILIYHLNGEKVASEFIEKNISVCAISWITYIEVLSFNLEEKLETDIIKFLRLFKIFSIDEEISEQAVSNRKSKKN